MSLVFLGDTPAERLDELRDLAARMEGRRFSLSFKQAACWRHNKVGFLSPEDTPPALVQLVYGLEEGLEAAGFNFDQRPYKPHVTLLRNTRCTTQVVFEPIDWHPEEFVLVASDLTRAWSGLPTAWAMEIESCLDQKPFAACSKSPQPTSFSVSDLSWSVVA